VHIRQIHNQVLEAKPGQGPAEIDNLFRMHAIRPEVYASQHGLFDFRKYLLLKK
jgi:hypothetical protein